MGKLKNTRVQIRVSIFLCVIALALPLFALTLVRVAQYSEGYRVAQLKKEQAELMAASKALALEIALLRRPERILNLAQKKLGMSKPRLDQLMTTATGEK